MSEQEYKQFLKSLFNQYIEPHIRLSHSIEDQLQIENKLKEESINSAEAIWRLKRAKTVVDSINRYCNTEKDIYKTFGKEKLISTIEDIRVSVSFSKGLASRWGFLSVIDDHFAEILDGIETKYFPPEELKYLRELGSEDPKADLIEIINTLKAEKEKLVSLTKERPASKWLDFVIETLHKEKTFIENWDRPNTKWNHLNPGPNLFFGLACIIDGTTLLTADILLALGILPPFKINLLRSKHSAPRAPKGLTWKTVVSAGGGMGTILTGVGFLLL